MKISGLILSAGLSNRMNSFKPLLTINDKPFVAIIIEKLLKICDEVVVVTGHNHELVKAVIVKYFIEYLNKIKIVFNENYKDGMFTSLQKGIANAEDFDWMIYHFVDQPTLSEKFYFDFVNQISDDVNWIQPSYNSVKGHPILFRKEIKSLISNENSGESLRDLSRLPAIIKLIWECSYPEIHHDLNTVNDLNRIKMDLADERL